MSTSLYILLGSLALIGICAGISIVLVVFHRVFRDWHHHRMLALNRMNIGEVFVTIDFIVKTECALYEQYFENNTNVEFTTLSNNEFTNIYNDLAMRCLKAVSPHLWETAEQFMTREEVQTYITQAVMQFLLSKTTVEEDEEETEAAEA